MPDGKVLAKVQSALSGQKILWQGDALLVDPRHKGMSQAYLAVTPTGLHFFQKKTFGVGQQSVSRGDVSTVSDGVTLNMDNGRHLEALMFRMGQAMMLLAPFPPTENAVSRLTEAMKLVAAG